MNNSARLFMPLFFLMITGLTACTSITNSTAELKPIKMQLSWTHSAQFAGFYTADQNGDYAAEGLAVTFVEGGSQVDRLTSVLEGAAQFGLVGGAELIIAQTEGKPLQALAAILRRDPFAFFSLADSGITRPEDFAGKKIQIRPRGQSFLHAVTQRVGVTPDQYIEDYEADFTDLYNGDVDVAVGFVTAQLLEAEAAGYQLNVIYPDDYGVHFYTDILFATDEFIAANPDLVRRFLRATLKGWTYAVEHPDEVGSLVAKYNPAADIALENAKMTASLPLINTGEDYIGWMKPEIWAGMVETLREQRVISEPVEPAQFYTTRFLEEIYAR